MTQEEKARAYDEALERARKELEQDLHESGVWAIQRIFPELRESEDERIREEIIEFLQNTIIKRGIKDGNDKAVKWIAYLEKQKEQKPDDKCKGCNNVKGCINCVDGSEWAHIEEKEQKPAEWSEEDEKMLHQVLRCLDPTLPRAKREEIELRLKSLRPSWKPSEEQMMALHYASYGGDLSPDELLLLDSLYNQLSELI